ncbi:MAG: hypothetical protein Q9167_005992 [Letrouitia subvulpina]
MSDVKELSSGLIAPLLNCRIMKLVALTFLSLSPIFSFSVPQLLPSSFNSSHELTLPNQPYIIPYPIPGTDIVLHVARGKPIDEEEIRGMLTHALENIADQIRKYGLYTHFEYWSTFYGEPELELYVKSFRPQLQWTELRSIIMELRTYFSRVRAWCDIDFQIYKLEKPVGQGRLQNKVLLGEEAIIIKRSSNGLTTPRASSALKIVSDPLKQMNESLNTMVYPVPHSNVVLEISFLRSMPAPTLKALLESAYNVVQDQIHLFGGGSRIPHGEFTWQLVSGNFFHARSVDGVMSWDMLGASLKGLDNVLVIHHHFSEVRAGINLRSGEGRRLVGYAYIRRYAPR